MAGMNRVVYGVSRWAVRVGLRWKYGLRCAGTENVPTEGGVVLAANHCSYLDPPVLACSVPRPVCFMARDTLFSNPVARWYFPRVGVIPLDRTRGDVAALRTAISLLKAGKAVGLYPEGTRSEDGKLHEAKGGIGFLIAKGGVPVVPMHISGTFEAFPKGAKKLRPGAIRVNIGQPISPEELTGAMSARNDYDAIGRLVMSRIADLAPKALP
jgi:1-acyl-sn-glycerol-3-phosphate acyltransferase